MALPKLGYPTFELELPSTGKTIKYRPFLVKEEKVLLMALESKDEKQVVSAVKDLIKNCVITNININDVEIFKPEGHDKKIMFDENTGLVMKYPSMKEFVDREFLQKEMKTEDVYEFIADSIDQIFDSEEVYDSSTTTKKEFRTFVDSLTTKQFEKIQKFYETSPKLSHTFKVTNPKTNKESSYTIEGLQSFFA